MNLEITENTLLYLLLRYWIPPLLIVGVGGILTNILLPRIQDKYLQEKSLVERRSSLREDIAGIFGEYIIWWRRLIQIQSAIKESRTSNPDRVPKLEEDARSIIDSRRKSRDDLFDKLNRLSIYSTQSFKEISNEYMAWDESLRNKGMDDVPDFSAWEVWRRKVLESSSLKRSIWCSTICRRCH